MGVLRWLFLGVLALALAFLVFSRFVGVERFVNTVDDEPLPPVSDEARRLHESSFVADLHADSLLFGRDLLARSSVGHVDVPRLREGGVALQIFTAATITPAGLDIDRNERDTFDMLTLVGLAQRSSFAWKGPLARALMQAERLHGFVTAAQGGLLLVRARPDLARLDEARAADRNVVGAMLGIEGAHALEADLTNLDVLYDAGFRMIGLTHFFDNEFAGSAHGVEKGGLTELGRELVREMERRGVLVDLAHASPAAVDDILAMATKPTVVSHGGVKGFCDNARNLSDDRARKVAAGGGVIGIGYWDWAACGIRPDEVAAAIRYTVDLVGDAHVGLGSDYDGGTHVAFDTSQLSVLTQAMLDAGLAPDSIRRILGENVRRVLQATLPPG